MFKHILRRWYEEGQGLAEYGLILALITVVVAGVILLVDLY